MELRICKGCKKVRQEGAACPACGAPLSLAEPSLFIGECFGKYRLERILGIGGMGVVYGVVHETLNRQAALKIVLPQLGGEGFSKRFLREAQVLAELKHPNIVEVYDFDISGWGPPYYVMEYLEGKPLRELINAHGRSISIDDYSPILADITSALSYAHSKGIVHRDLKPENIFVVAYGDRTVGKILDFGIAKAVGARSTTTDLTLAGAVMGTPNYLSPEQLLERPVGPYTDQYALALIVAEMVIGKPVRSGKTLGEICAVETQRPLVLGQLGSESHPGAVSSAVEKATNPEPGKRFQSVGEFLEALGLDFSAGAATLGRLLESRGYDMTIEFGTDSRQRSSPKQPTPRASPPSGEAFVPTRASLPTRTRGGIKRHVRAAAFAAGVLILAAILLFYWPRPRRSPPPLEKASHALALLELAAEIPVPPDARGILGYSFEEKTFVLLGSSCVYLLPEIGGRDASRIQLEPDAEVLGQLHSGEVLLKMGGGIVARDFISGKERVIAKSIPKGERHDVSPSGRHIAAFEKGGFNLYRLAPEGSEKLFSLPADQRQPLAVGDRYAATIAGEQLQLFSIPDGRMLWSKPAPGAGVLVIKLQELAGLVAVGGRFDQIFLYDIAAGGARTAVPRRGETYSLDFIPDDPTLAIGGDNGLKLWRRDGGEVGSHGSPGERCISTLATGRGLLAIDSSKKALRVFSYRGFPLEKEASLGKREIWAMAWDPDGRAVYAGGADGNLYSVDPQTMAVAVHALHTQGLTWLAADGQLMASSSDDKTIAVWKLPKMEVIWRSKAHSYLINFLALRGTPPHLWSSSSDGIIKKWAWPQLDEVASISTTDVVGRRLSLAALWISSDGATVVAGTWDSALLVLRQRGVGKWEPEVVAVPSQSLYSVSEIMGRDALLFVGVGKHSGVYVYDLKSWRLSEIDSTGFELQFSSPAGEDGGVVVFGAGCLLNYTFERDHQGALSYSIRVKFNSDLGLGTAGACQPSRGLIAVGDHMGNLHTVRRDSLKGAPIATGLVK